jgi:mannan endo-1,4-beta-mannosidase
MVVVPLSGGLFAGVLTGTTSAATATTTGPGTMVVSPTSVLTATSGHKFKFTYRAPGSAAVDGQLTLVVPSAWTPPQNTSSTSPGYLSVAKGNCTSVSLAGLSDASGKGTGPWTATVAINCGKNTSFTLTYGGAGTMVTAPTAHGGYQFTTAVKWGSSTSFVPIATQPVVYATGPLASLKLSPPSVTGWAGVGQAFTAAGYDAYGDPMGTVTAATAFSIAPDGTCSGATCTPAASGPHTVTGTDGAATGTAALTAQQPPSTGPGSVVASPGSVLAASSGHAFAFTYTAPGNASVKGDVELVIPAGWTAPEKSSSISPGYVSVTKGDCSSASLVAVSGSGPWTVTASMDCSKNDHFAVGYGGGGTAVTAPSVQGMSTFTASVESGSYPGFVPIATQPVVYATGPLASLQLSPPSVTGWAGVGQAFTAAGYDANGYPMGDVTAGTTFKISPDGACSGATCTPAASGPHTVTGTDGAATGTAALTAQQPPGSGPGTVTASPFSAPVSTSGHTFAFTYTAPGSGTVNGDLEMVVPSGWTAPQKSTSISPGYVSVTKGDCSSASLTSVSGSGPWTVTAKMVCGKNDHFAIAYGGGGTAVTAPAAHGPSTFTTSVKTGSYPYYVPIAAQPVLYATGPVASLKLVPASATMTAGQSELYTADTYDAYGDPVADVTPATAFAISPDGTCTTAKCTATVAGPHTITGTDGSLVATASLSVQAGPLAKLVLSPPTATQPVMVPQEFTAEGYDSYGNDLGDETANTTFTISTGNCYQGSGTGKGGNYCHSMVAGPQKVVGTDGTVNGDATLTVTAGPLANLQLNPSTATISTGKSQTYQVDGFDAYGNNLGDQTSATTLSISPDGTCSAATCTPAAVGVHTVTATDGAVTATATLTVVAPTGPGTMSVSPDSVPAGSGGHAFVFSYTAPSNKTVDGNMAFGVPSGWTAPQKSKSTSAGYVSLNKGKCASVTLKAVTGTGPWVLTLAINCASGKGFTLTYGGSGTAAVAAPSTAGPYPFNTEVALGSSTTYLPLAALPSVAATGPLSYLEVSPPTPTVTTGVAQSFAAQGYDAEGDLIGDETAQSTFKISPEGSCTGATCTATALGTHTVTVTDGSATGSTTEVISPSPLTASGSQLLFNGQPYQGIGLNVDQCGDPGELDVFDQLPPGSIVRYFAFQGKFYNQTTKTWDFTQLTKALNDAQSHDDVLDVVLSTQPGICDDGAWHDISWYEGGYNSVYNYSGMGGPLSFYQWMQKIVSTYATSPAIGMWELVNEPQPGTCDPGYQGKPCYSHMTCPDPTAATDAMVSFYNTVGAELRALDPYHLMAFGSQGTAQCGIAGTGYLSVLQSPYINVATYHDYDQNGVALPADLSLRLSEAVQEGKPLIVEETGINAASSGTSCATLAQRANQMQAKIEAAFKAGAQAYLPWRWNSTPPPAGCNQDIASGDPLMADLTADAKPVSGASQPTFAGEWLSQAADSVGDAARLASVANIEGTPVTGGEARQPKRGRR